MFLRVRFLLHIIILKGYVDMYMGMRRYMQFAVYSLLPLVRELVQTSSAYFFTNSIVLFISFLFPGTFKQFLRMSFL